MWTGRSGWLVQKDDKFMKTLNYMVNDLHLFTLVELGKDVVPRASLGAPWRISKLKKPSPLYRFAIMFSPSKLPNMQATSSKRKGPDGERSTETISPAASWYLGGQNLFHSPSECQVWKEASSIHQHPPNPTHLYSLDCSQCTTMGKCTCELIYICCMS